MERWQTSRKRRQRYRRRRATAAEANVDIDSVPDRGAFAEGMPISSQDIRLVRRAIREGWSPTRRAKRQAPERVCDLVGEAESTREMLRAAGLLIAMHRENLDRNKKFASMLVAAMKDSAG